MRNTHPAVIALREHLAGLGYDTTEENPPLQQAFVLITTTEANAFGIVVSANEITVLFPHHTKEELDRSLEKNPLLFYWDGKRLYAIRFHFLFRISMGVIRQTR